MAYRVKRKDFEHHLKYIKPGALFESVSQKIKKVKIKDTTKESHQLEENTFELKKKIVSNFYKNPLKSMSKIYSKLSKTDKRIEESKTILNEKFNINVFEEKALKDLTFIKYLVENYILETDINEELKENIKNTLMENVKSLLNDVITLYNETDTKPRYINIQLNRRDLSENEIIDTYKRELKYFLEENYLKKLKFNTKELTENENIKKMTKFLIENDIDVDLNELIIYYPFEETLVKFFESILIPDLAMKKINLFIESQSNEYFEIFENNAKVLLESIEEKISKIVSLIAPLLFNKTVENADFNPLKYAGVSVVCKKIDNGPLVCKVQKENELDDTDLEKIKEIADEDAKDLEDIDDEALNELEDEIDAQVIDQVCDAEKAEETAAEIEDDEEDDENEEKENKKKQNKEKVEETTFVDANRPVLNAMQVQARTGINDKDANTKQDLEKINNEEIIPDEADDVKDLGDAAKTDKNFDSNFAYEESKNTKKEILKSEQTKPKI